MILYKKLCFTKKYAQFFLCIIFIQSIFAQEVKNTEVIHKEDSKSDIGKQDQTPQGLFLKDKDIKTHNKPTLIVFYKDKCYYCQILETSLIENSAISGYIELNFSAYNINIESFKKYNIPHLSLSNINARDIARLYEIRALPLMVFMDEDSKEIMRIVGFIGEQKILHLLEYINNDIWKQYPNSKERAKGFLEYEKQFYNNKDSNNS